MNVKQLLADGIKTVAFRVFALNFNVAAKLGIKKNSIVLFNLIGKSGFSGALGEVKTELEKMGGFDIEIVDRDNLFAGTKALIKFMTIDAFTMARARILFINNNFFPFAYTSPNKEQKLVQVWHGQGAFKKFGLDIPQPPKVRKKEIGANRNVSFVTCSAESIRPIYMSAFGLPAQKVIVTGNPVTDYFFREENVGNDAVMRKRADFDEKYKLCKGKRLYLYAPTFRDTPEDDENIINSIDLKRLKIAINKGITEESVLLVRLHPNDSSGREGLRRLCDSAEGILDVTDYPDSNELCILSDVLITDYSSICMNNALLNKPVVFYAYDFDSFSGARDFYYDYEKTVGGPVAKDMDELVRIFEEQDFRPERLAAFRELHFGDPDGKATVKMLNQVL